MFVLVEDFDGETDILINACSADEKTRVFQTPKTISGLNQMPRLENFRSFNEKHSNVDFTI